VVGARMIAERGVSTLVLVHRRQLLDQWRERLTTFLNRVQDGASKGEQVIVGEIGGGRNRPTGILDVALLQSIGRAGEVDELVNGYGQIIVDECHHLSAFTFEQVLRKAKARFVLGLTATPYRKDGHHPIIIMQCGPIRFRATARTAGADSTVEHVVIPRATEYQLPKAEKELGIQEVYASLVTDERRNDLIFNDLLLALEKGRSPILLTERTEHLEYFAARLRNFAKNIIVLRGGMGRRQRAEVAQRLAAVPDGEERLLLATGRYIGEGFDDSRLDTMLLALPISWRGTLQQYAGRLHRTHAGKRVVQIYDYVDEQVPVLGRMYRKRLRGYRAMGYAVTQADPFTASSRSEEAPSVR
jgi:superfamily II DNA or RNA helicase